MEAFDYGAIAFKNGKLISTEVFTPMIDMVGWEDSINDVYESNSHEDGESESNYTKPINLKGNYFAYIGDAECTLAFYKDCLVIVEKYYNEVFSYRYNYFGSTKYTWLKWEDFTKGFAKVKVTKRNGYYICKWKYKGDKYRVYFGHGVNLNYYKKYRIVTYYRSPEYILYKINSWLENLKYRRM